MNKNDEISLIEGLRSGRRESFHLAVRHYSAAMLATARVIAGPPHADDIVQDVWLTVFQRIDSFEGRSSFKTWLQRIVANRAISSLRSRPPEVSPLVGGEDESNWFDASGSWKVPPPMWHEDSPDALLEAEDLKNCIDKHLADMPESQRNVLVLRDMQQTDFDEICNELNLSASNARVLLHRGRTRLMKMVNHFRETGSC